MKKILLTIAYKYNRRITKWTIIEEPEELFEHFKFEVPKGQAPLRIDKYLMGWFKMQPEQNSNAATEGNIL
jgi:hypothetical protein